MDFAKEQVIDQQKISGRVIERVLEDLYEALWDHDAHKAVHAFASENVMYTMAPPLQSVSGSSPGEEGVRQWLGTFEVGPSFDIRDQHVEVSGDLAVAYRLMHMSGKKTDGEMVDLWYRETNCLRRESGEWRIFHQHQSVPFYMDKAKRAATDLRPEMH